MPLRRGRNVPQEQHALHSRRQDGRTQRAGKLRRQVAAVERGEEGGQDREPRLNKVALQGSQQHGLEGLYKGVARKQGHGFDARAPFYR